MIDYPSARGIQRVVAKVLRENRAMRDLPMRRVSAPKARLKSLTLSNWFEISSTSMKKPYPHRSDTTNSGNCLRGREPDSLDVSAVQHQSS